MIAAANAELHQLTQCCTLQRLRFLQAAVRPHRNSIAVPEPVPIRPRKRGFFANSMRKLFLAADREVHTNVIH